MAHGLELRMEDMLRHKFSEKSSRTSKNPPFYRNEAAATVLNDVILIQAWIEATKYPKNSKLEYLNLLRQTLLLMLTPKWNESRKEDVVHAYSSYCQKFSTISSNCAKLHDAVLKIADKNPWHNPYTSWDGIFQGTVAVEDVGVSNYFASEPEEVILARAHSLVIQNHIKPAYGLVKMCFLYNSRIAGHFNPSRQRRDSNEDDTKVGYSTIDWLSSLMQGSMSLAEITEQIQQFKCHEGIEIILRLRRDPENLKFCFIVLQVILLEDLIGPSQYCCTKKLFVLFCVMHREIDSSPAHVSESVRKLFAKYAPSSSHLYLFVDVLWKQYGMKCLDLYVEMYVRAITADINHLEAKKDSGSSADVSCLETHLATVFTKLSTLFSGFLDIAARECMFSAFSLRPTKERLCILQSLTQNLLSVDEKGRSTSLSEYKTVETNCNCRMKCTGPCKTKQIGHVLNPLLNMDVKTIAYHLIKDLVCVLENVRSIKFQYNFFDWLSSFTELEEYMKTYQNKAALKDWGSDTEVASEESGRSDTEDTNSVLESPVKKIKRNLFDINPTSALDVAVNIEVASNDDLNKRIKMYDPGVENQICRTSETTGQYPQLASSAIETLIRATLSENNPKGQSSKYILSLKSPNENYGDIGRAKFEVNSQSPNNTVYPYSLTDYGKRENLDAPSHLSNKSMKRIKSSVECQNNLMTHYSNEKSSATSSTNSTLNRQSVVITPPNNTPVKKSVFVQKQVPHKTMPFSIQSSIVNPVYKQVKVNDSYKMQNITENATKEGALNLSCSSDSQRDRQLLKFHALTPQLVSSQQSSKTIQDHLKYTNLPNTTPFNPSFSSKPQASQDRNSVIQHTMQHVQKRPIAVSREVLVSLDSTELKKLESNESEFCINVSKEIVFKPDELATGTLKFNRKPNHQQLNTQASPVNNETITIPGIISSPLRSSQKLQFTKLNSTPINTTITSSVKKVYHKPYMRALPSTSKPQIEPLRNDIGTSYTSRVGTQLKSVPDSSWSRKQFPSSSGSQVSSSNPNKKWQVSDAITYGVQPWNMSNAMTSVNQSTNANYTGSYDSHRQSGSKNSSDSTNKTLMQSQLNSGSHSMTTSSNQAWYSKPYPQPKMYNSATSISNKTAGSLSTVNITTTSYSVTKSQTHPENDPKYTTSTSLLKSRLAGGQVFSSIVPNLSSAHQEKHTSTYSKSYGYPQKLLGSQDHVQVSSSFSHLPVSSSVTCSYNANSLSHCDRLQQSESHHNLDMHNNSGFSTDGQGVALQTTNNTNLIHNLNSSSTSRSSKICCSPAEVDPCQTCSPTEKAIKEPSKLQHSFSEESTSYQASRGTSFDLAVSSVAPNAFIAEELEDIVTECKFCTFSVPASLMEMHIEESHRNMQLNQENYKSFAIDSNKFSDSSGAPNLISEKSNYWTSTATEEQSAGEHYSLQNKTLYLEHNLGRNENEVDQPLPPMQFLTETLLHGSTPPSFSEMLKDASNTESHITHENTTFNKELTAETTTMDSKFCNVEQEISKSDDPKNCFNLHTNEKELENSSKAIMPGASLDFGRIHEVPNKHITSEGFVFCNICNKRLRSKCALRRHIKKFHSLNKNFTQPTESEKLLLNNLSVSDKSNSVQTSQEYEFDFSGPDSSKTGSYQSIHFGKLAVKSNSDIAVISGTQNNDQLNKDASQTEGKTSKNKLKGIKKPCEYCGKSLTTLYMKTHILRKHGGILQVQDINSNQNASSTSNNNELAFQTISTLLQEDINTRTCLSPSDAMNIDSRFDMDTHGNMSDSSVKTESNGGKFPSQMIHTGKKNASSKFKLINKASPLTLKPLEDQKDVTFMNENQLQSKLTEDYRCHVCFRKYISKSFLNKHLQNFHNLSASELDHSNSNLKSLKEKLDSTEYIQDSKAILKEDQCSLNPTEFSDLPNADYIPFSNEIYNEMSVNSGSACTEQINSVDNCANADSRSQLIESDMPISSYNSSISGLKQTTYPEKVKNKRPKNFKCTLCFKVFSYSKNLQKHIEKYHPNNLSLKTDLDSTFQSSNNPAGNQEYNHSMENLNSKSNLSALVHHETSTHQNKPFFNLKQSETVLNNGSYGSSDPSTEVSLSKSDSFFNTNGCSSEDLTNQNGLNLNVDNQNTNANAFTEKLSFSDIHTNQPTPSKQIVSTCSSYNENVSYDSFDQNENNTFFSSNEIHNDNPKSKLFTDMLKDSPDTNDPYQTNSFTASSSQSIMRTMSPVYVQQSNINLESSSISTESNECPVCFKKLSTQDQLQHHIEKLHPLSSVDEVSIHQVNKLAESENQNMFSQLQHIYPVVNSLVTTTNKGIEGEATFVSSYNENSPTDENEKSKHELLFSELCNSSNLPNLVHTSSEFQNDIHSTYSKELYSTVTTTKTDFPEKQMELVNDQNKNSMNVSAFHASEHVNENSFQKCDIFNIDPIMLSDDNDSAFKHALMFSDLLDEFEAHTNQSIDARNKFDNGEYEQTCSEKETQKDCYASTQNSSLIDSFISSHSKDNPSQNMLYNSSVKVDSKIVGDYYCKSQNNFDLPVNSVSVHDIFADKFVHEKPCSSTAFQSEKQDNTDPSSYSTLNSLLEKEIQECGYITSVSSQALPSHKHGKTINELSLATCNFEDKIQSKVNPEKEDSLNNMQQFLENEEIVKEFSILLHSRNGNSTHNVMNISDSVSTKDAVSVILENPPITNENSNPDHEDSSTNDGKTYIEPKDTKPKSTKIIALHRKPPLQREYVCDICSKPLTHSWTLKRHILKQHPNAPVPIKTKAVFPTSKCVVSKSSCNDKSKESNTSSSNINKDLKQSNFHHDNQSTTDRLSTESLVNLNHDKNFTQLATDSTFNQNCLNSPLILSNNSNSIVKSRLLVKSKDTNDILPNDKVLGKRKSLFKKKKCLVCLKELCSSGSLTRHMMKLHPEVDKDKKLFVADNYTSNAESFASDQRKSETILNQRVANLSKSNLLLPALTNEDINENFVLSDNLMSLPSINSSFDENFTAKGANLLHDNFEQSEIKKITNSAHEDKIMPSVIERKQIQCQNGKSDKLVFDKIKLEKSLDDSKEEIDFGDSFCNQLDRAPINIHPESYSDVLPVQFGSKDSTQSVSNKCISPESNQNSHFLCEEKALAKNLHETLFDDGIKCINERSLETYNFPKRHLDKIALKNSLGDPKLDQHVDLVNSLPVDKIENTSKQPSKIFPSECSNGDLASNIENTSECSDGDLISNTENTSECSDGGLVSNIQYTKTKALENKMESLSPFYANDTECFVKVSLVDDCESSLKETVQDLRPELENTANSNLEKQLNSHKNASKIIASEVPENKPQHIQSKIKKSTKIEPIKKELPRTPIMREVASNSTPITSISVKDGKNSSLKNCSSSNKLKVTNVKSSAKLSNPILSYRYKKNFMKCKVCPKVFRKRANLSCHLKTVHNLPFHKQPSPHSNSESSKGNKHKFSPPKLFFDSCKDLSITSNFIKNVHNKMADKKKGFSPQNVPSGKAETINELSKLETSNMSFAEDLECVNKQKREIRRAKRMSLETNSNQPQDLQNEVELLSFNQKTLEKNSEVKDSNFIKRRSQRSSSCEIIEEIIRKKTFRRKRPFKSGRKIGVIRTKKNVLKCNIRCSSKKSSAVPFNHKKAKNISKTIEKVPSSKSSIPKCIIKVCKDEKNSVFYQSLNIKSEISISPESSPTPLDNNTDKMSHNKSQISINARSRSYPSRKKHTVLMSTLRSRRHSAPSKSSSSTNLTLKPKNKKIKAGVAQSQQKCNQNDEISNKNAFLHPKQRVKESECSVYPFQTFKDPEETERFLREHEQPIVNIQRLTNSCVSDSSTPSDNFSCPTFELKRPVVRLTRIDSLKRATTIIHQDHILQSTSQGETNKPITNCSISSSEISVKPMDLEENKKETSPNFQEPTCSAKLPDLGVNAESLDNQCSPAKDNEGLPRIKKCLVLLSKLPI